jgi:hypothetical protein
MNEQTPVEDDRVENAELLAIAHSAKRFNALGHDAKIRVIAALKADLEQRHPEMSYTLELLKTGQVKISVTPR